jgi:hypothetical protein
MAGKSPSGMDVSGELWFIVRPSKPGQNTKILLQLATNTYNAYTNWGGYSLYGFHARDKVQGRRVSYNRPVSSQFNSWEAPFVRRAESNGYTLDYAANSDLEFHPVRDNLEKFIGAGGNVAFFSGNTCCWQVRSEEKGRALTCWKQEFQQDPYFDKGEFKLLSSLWSHHRTARPENQLTGVFCGAVTIVATGNSWTVPLHSPFTAQNTGCLPEPI